MATVASAVRDGIRSEDTVGAYGADGLLVVLPHTDPAAGAQLAKRLSARITGTSPGDPERSWYASIGLAACRVGRSVDMILSEVHDVQCAGSDGAGREGAGGNELPPMNGDLRRAPAGDLPSIDRCPLSPREIEVMRRLARGMVYKQIAHELGLSTSTVRQHLHNVYPKLGVVDRAQAVLIATKRGWI